MSQVVTQILWAVFYTYGFMYQSISLFFIFCRIYFPTKIIYVTMSFTLPKIFRENQEGFQSFFLAGHVRWCCMYSEQYYQGSFVIPPTILETTTAGKVPRNTITLYNGSVIQYWRSCTPSRSIGLYFWGVRGSWAECHFLFSLVYQLCLALW